MSTQEWLTEKSDHQSDVSTSSGLAPSTSLFSSLAMPNAVIPVISSDTSLSERGTANFIDNITVPQPTTKVLYPPISFVHDIPVPEPVISTSIYSEPKENKRRTPSHAVFAPHEDVLLASHLKEVNNLRHPGATTGSKYNNRIAANQFPLDQFPNSGQKLKCR